MAVQDAKPVHFQMGGNTFSVHLLAEPHRLPRRNRRVSAREATRLWLVCMDCRQKRRKLFTFPKFPGSSVLVMPFCRQCLGLTYQSQNCGGNRWWRETARPLKRLLHRRELLVAKKHTEKMTAQLDLLDQSINLLRQRAAPKTRRKHPNDLEFGQSLSGKRRYRDLDPILQSLPC